MDEQQRRNAEAEELIRQARHMLTRAIDLLAAEERRQAEEREREARGR